MQLRKHQRELQEIAVRIRNGENITKILAHIVQGGGKSMIASILAKELVEPLGWRIVWIVPRDALRTQGVKDFNNKNKTALGYQAEIREARNESNPAQGKNGYVTTYQSVTQQPTMHLAEISSHPYILILDEFHHVPLGSTKEKEEAAYYAAVAPLVEVAKLCVFCTGSIERHNKDEKIAFAPYRSVVPGEIIDEYLTARGEHMEVLSEAYGEVIDPSRPQDGWAYIRYGIKEALSEGAVAPIIFHECSATLAWQSTAGVTKAIKNTRKEEGEGNNSVILETILKTKYAFDLLDNAVGHWMEHKKQYYWAKLLIVASGINDAKAYHEYLRGVVSAETAATYGIDKKPLWKLGSRIATSDDSRDAKEAISSFKGALPEIDILVTVGMAYEGLDVPKLTHVVYLTNIRSRPWAEQAFNRGNRANVDAITEKTECHVFCPDDQKIQRIIGRIEHEQRSVVVKREIQEPVQKGLNRVKITPLSSGLIGERQKVIGGELLSEEQVQIFKAVSTAYGYGSSVPPAILYQMFVDVLKIQVERGLFFDESSGVDEDKSEAPDMEEDLRRAIRGAIMEIAGGNQERVKAIDTMLKRKHGARHSLREDKLQEVLVELEAQRKQVQTEDPAPDGDDGTIEQVVA